MISKVDRDGSDSVIYAWETALKAPWCVSILILLHPIHITLASAGDRMDMALDFPSQDLQGLEP